MNNSSKHIFSVQVLVSTMNQLNPHRLVRDMRVKDYVLINQITNKKYNEAVNDHEKNNAIISIHEKGLSRSRNRAIKEASANICVLADDDMYYSDDYEQIIINAYNKFTDADIIAFHINSEIPHYKKQKLKEGKIGLLKTMKLSSVQITLKKESIIKSQIAFNEQFGAGSKYYMGEENIFLADCLKKGLKIYYVPRTIATLKMSDSTWFKGYTNEYFEIKGRVYFMISKLIWIMLNLQFAVRKHKLYKNQTSAVIAYFHLCKGSVMQCRDYIFSSLKIRKTKMDD